MAFKKPIEFQMFQEEFPDAYHRVERWNYDNLYWHNCISVTVFAYRTKADAEHNDTLGLAALQAGEPVPMGQMIGPIGQQTFNLSLFDFGSKEDMTMAKTYELLAQMDEWADAESV